LRCLHFLSFLPCASSGPRPDAKISAKFQNFFTTSPPPVGYLYLISGNLCKRCWRTFMKTTPLTEAPLSPRWTFVVQLRQGTTLTAEAVYGRVEHLVSGQAALFTSLEEVRAFMARVVAKLQDEPP